MNWLRRKFYRCSNYPHVMWLFAMHQVTWYTRPDGQRRRVRDWYKN